MDIEFLEADAVDEKLKKFIVKYEKFYWAVAWGAMTPAAKMLFVSSEKFEHVTFGVAFSQTHPDLIDNLIGIEGALVATKFPGGTYHPKVYGFRSGGRAAAIVGSANFTFGGLGKNLEAAIALEGNAADPFFKELFAFTRKCAGFGEPVTPQYARAYRASFKRASCMAKPPRDPMEGLRQVKPSGFSSSIISMSWAEFVRCVNAAAEHDVAESLELLAITQKWFASISSFGDFSREQRKAVAGIIGKHQKISDDLDHHWGWFGSMKGAGDFANRIDANDEYLARALDMIPQKGEVTKEHFVNFRADFARAFRHSAREGQLATATRLLAMKRPDTFVCICKPNVTEAARLMGFAKSALNLDDYWEKVIEIVRLSDWYNFKKPSGKDGELWESRVAMLDAIFYQPG